MLPETLTRDEARARHVCDRMGLRREEDRDLLGESHSEAVFSADGQYRYLLIRRWHPGGDTCTFALLNPSTATAFVSDPTVTRCIGYARREGCSALAIVNAFGLRSTDPAQLRKHADPVGEHNDRFLTDHCLPGRLVIAGWGAHGSLNGRGAQVARMLAERGVALQCLGTTKAGAPLHPLYLKADAPLIPYEVAS